MGKGEEKRLQAGRDGEHHLQRREKRADRRFIRLASADDGRGERLCWACQDEPGRMWEGTSAATQRGGGAGAAHRNKATPGHGVVSRSSPHPCRPRALLLAAAAMIGSVGGTKPCRRRRAAELPRPLLDACPHACHRPILAPQQASVLPTARRRLGGRIWASPPGARCRCRHRAPPSALLPSPAAAACSVRGLRMPHVSPQAVVRAQRDLRLWDLHLRRWACRADSRPCPDNSFLAPPCQAAPLPMASPPFRSALPGIGRRARACD